MPRMKTKIGIFWPGDYRARPNDLARPNAEEATPTARAGPARLGRTSYRIEGFLTRPTRPSRSSARSTTR